MFRGQGLDLLRQRKQALLLESAAYRLALQAEWRHLRTSANRASGALRSPKLAVPALLLAALAGYLLTRRRVGSLFKSVAWAAKWAVPLFRIWKSLAPAAPPSRTE